MNVTYYLRYINTQFDGIHIFQETLFEKHIVLVFCNKIKGTDASPPHFLVIIVSQHEWPS